ncbi:hypothetical protein E3A20_24310 [Planctomyces bekefii]|uniref:HNH nuclease domain-containing protein n=1 Tax=Planctomyces bekefii TaxID=1653850 RepID=A0A5C6M2W9_9PLAN|nr:hypothetical protein E3A20_24310 [Planctomyces bekefii]
MRNVWKIAPGLNASTWKECRARKCISINWLNDFDLSDFSHELVIQTLIELREGKKGSAETIRSFIHEVQPRDIVVANRGLSGVVGIGIVRSRYLPPSHKKNPNRRQQFSRHVRLVEWVIDVEIPLDKKLFNQPTLQRLKLQQIEQIKAEYSAKHPELRASLTRLFPCGLDADQADDGVDDFIPPDEDTRQTVERQVKARRGQKRFRDAQLRRFSGKCVVTGCCVVDLLEAAHLSPYRGEGHNHEANGLLLRADIHTLLDLNLMAINPADMRLLISVKLQEDETYRKYNRKELMCPAKTNISRESLIDRFEAFISAERER